MVSSDFVAFKSADSITRRRLPGGEAQAFGGKMQQEMARISMRKQREEKRGYLLADENSTVILALPVILLVCLGFNQLMKVPRWYLQYMQSV